MDTTVHNAQPTHSPGAAAMGGVMGGAAGVMGEMVTALVVEVVVEDMVAEAVGPAKAVGWEGACRNSSHSLCYQLLCHRRPQAADRCWVAEPG